MELSGALVDYSRSALIEKPDASVPLEQDHQATHEENMTRPYRRSSLGDASVIFPPLKSFLDQLFLC